MVKKGDISQHSFRIASFQVHLISKSKTWIPKFSFCQITFRPRNTATGRWKSMQLIHLTAGSIDMRTRANIWDRGTHRPGCLAIVS